MHQHHTNESTSLSHHKDSTAGHVVLPRHQSGGVDLMEENRMSPLHLTRLLHFCSVLIFVLLSYLLYSLCNACGLHYAKIIKREVLVPARKSETTTEAMSMRTLLN
jgi:hypothetical protein